MRTILCSLVLSLCVGCVGDNETSLSASDACAEQSDAWCSAIGFTSSSGCRTVYTHEVCKLEAGPVRASMQDACIDALSTMTCGALGCSLPSSCASVWSHG